MDGAVFSWRRIAIVYRDSLIREAGVDMLDPAACSDIVPFVAPIRQSSAPMHC